MVYQITTAKSKTANWPKSEYIVKAKNKWNKVVEIPVFPINILTVGTTGYGKTVFTKAYIRNLFKADEKMYAVFFQIKPDDFTSEFLRPQDKIITYSEKVCSDRNLFKWNLVREIRSYDRSEWDSELEEMASILFSDILLDSRNRIWAEAAKTTFKAFVRVILYCYKNTPCNKQLIEAMKNMGRKQLLKFLAEYEPNRSILKDNFEFDPDNRETYVIPRKGSDILFFCKIYSKNFRAHLCRKQVRILYMTICMDSMVSDCL